jgi:hypothetical protein
MRRIRRLWRNVKRRRWLRRDMKRRPADRG